MEEDSIPDQAPFIDFVWMSSELWFLSGFIGIKNETLRIQLVSCNAWLLVFPLTCSCSAFFNGCLA